MPSLRLLRKNPEPHFYYWLLSVFIWTSEKDYKYLYLLVIWLPRTIQEYFWLVPALICQAPRCVSLVPQLLSSQRFYFSFRRVPKEGRRKCHISHTAFTAPQSCNSLEFAKGAQGNSAPKSCCCRRGVGDQNSQPKGRFQCCWIPKRFQSRANNIVVSINN